MYFPTTFDVVVIGGGHAGTEAALAGARMGVNTLLLTQSIETLGQMSCNPAIGGIGKGHLVREIDALGGWMAQGADVSGIQFRTLNSSKGPAVRATRAQIDRSLYRQATRKRLESQANLTLFQQTVEDLEIGDDEINVVTQLGVRFRARTVVLTVGTFLGGRIHVGESNYQGGRAGDAPSNTLAERLRALPFRVERLKTGTPPRIASNSIDYTQLQTQPGDDPVPVFSYLGSAEQHPRQVTCHITHTNEHTHDIIRNALHRSPLYAGVIEGVGPRYCPSVEDKVVRFADKTSHQIFIEPEGLESAEVYPNGISTSLPFDVQLDLVQSIAGFEKAHITRAGYAIEYDFFDPRDLHPTLRTKLVDRLYFAGQINGTTGYEEAAAQGLLAGANAALQVQGKAPWYPRRDEAYLGVLVDDLVTQGTTEPYRMFTSRAEYRLLLREDNADLRLTQTGRSLGLVDDKRWSAFETYRDSIEQEAGRLKSHWVQPSSVSESQAVALLGAPLQREYSLHDLLKRPKVSYADLMHLAGAARGVEDVRAAEQLEVQAKYDGYIGRQAAEIAKSRLAEATVLPLAFDYSQVSGLSAEVSQKLNEAKPATLGQAGRIPGVTPAALSLLLIHLKKGQLGVAALRRPA